MRKKSNNIFYGGKSECGPALQLNSASHRVRTSSVLCKFTKCVCLVTSNSSVTLWPTPVRLPYPWGFSGKNTRVGCHFLLQGIFPSQGSNPGLLCLLHCRQILYHWVPGKLKEASESRSVMSDSLRPHGLYSPWNSPGQNTGMGSLSLLQGSSQPRDGTQVSCTAGRFFTSWSQGSPSEANSSIKTKILRDFCQEFSLCSKYNDSHWST